MILVTGAVGFIGSNLVAALNERGHDDLVLCDWLGTDGRWRNLAKRCFSNFVFPDQLDAYLTSREAEKIDLVLHMGAISDTTTMDGDSVMKNNYQFTKTLWNWCAATSAVFVYASSAATYGDGADSFSDTLDFQRLKRIRPLNLYGWSKHVFDLYAMGAPPNAPANWYGLKFFNVFGPNEYHKGAMRSVICKSAPAIIAGDPVKLFESHNAHYEHGGQLRDFIYVEDACDAVLHLAGGHAESGLYNVGTGQARSFADLIGAGYRGLGLEPRIEYMPMPEDMRPAYQYFTEATTDKLRGAGYCKAIPDLETSVARYMTDYLVAHDKYV